MNFRVAKGGRRSFEFEQSMIDDESYHDDFDDVVENSLENDDQLNRFAQNFHKDVQGLARFYLQQFFCDKTMYCGGKIPRSLLEKRISMVINYDISKGVLQAYDAMSDLFKHEVRKDSCESTSDIKLVNETLSLLAKSGVPQQFAGGMLLLYLEFVEGIEIGT